MTPLRAIVAPSLVYRLAEAAARTATLRRRFQDAAVAQREATFACVPDSDAVHVWFEDDGSALGRLCYSVDDVGTQVKQDIASGLQLRRVDDAP